jgi:mannose-6-phosphate isomerase-like protein (cupin superfamily)
MDGQDSSYHLFGNVLTFRARPSAGSAFLLTECRSLPGAGAPPNLHPQDGEGFYILEGEYEFMVDGAVRVVGPGTYVAIPAGAPHAFRNTGTAEARMLIVNAPGVLHEAFFSTLGQPLAPGEIPPPPPQGPPPEAVLARLRAQAAACGVMLLV